MGAPDEYAGRRVKCVKCAQSTTIPEPEAELELAEEPLTLAPDQTDVMFGSSLFSQDAFGAGGLDALFDRWDEDTIDIGADQGLFEVHS